VCRGDEKKEGSVGKEKNSNDGGGAEKPAPVSCSRGKKAEHGKKRKFKEELKTKGTGRKSRKIKRGERKWNNDLQAPDAVGLGRFNEEGEGAKTEGGLRRGKDREIVKTSSCRLNRRARWESRNLINKRVKWTKREKEGSKNVHGQKRVREGGKQPERKACIATLGIRQLFARCRGRGRLRERAIGRGGGD